MGKDLAPARPEAEPDAFDGDYDLYSWAVSLGVSPAELKQAIAEVGDDAAAVRRQLAQRGPAKP